METLTSRQREVLALIKEHLRAHGESPTLQELGRSLGVSSLRTVAQYLEALEKKGFIGRIKNKTRNIMPLDHTAETHGGTVTLPVVGAAACGTLNVYAEEAFNEFIQVSRSFLGERNTNEVIVIRALGLSMQDAGIDDGDLVIIEFTENIKNGDVVAAVIDGMAVIKKIQFTPNAVILNPVTSIGSYTQIVMRRDFKVLGRLLHVIKAQKHDDVVVVPVLVE